ncbi:hypothetical protein [uncultured Ruminococcus sp.]|uniref:hypothetical protein n=1 Tax=uncultured Ruminococcus sp. TaxID=165186 RepID=UPI0025DDDA16|nr:hypothetical protein [uncultured Ruminococcus sp.]
MEEKKEFDILENTEQSVIDRLSEEFPPDDAEEKEKVFRMSQEKFNKANNTAKFTETDEQTVSGVEVVCKRPLWKKCLSMAAAAAILIGGAAGGFKAYKHFANTPTQNKEEENKIAPFGDFMATKYQICDYTSEPLFTLTQKNTATDEYDEDTDAPPVNDISIYGGTDIPEDKRQKLADFINSYNYKEVYTIDPEHPFPQQIMGNSAVGNGVFDILVNFFMPKQTGKNDPVAEAILRGEEPPKPQYENLTGLEKTVYSPFFIYIDGNRIKTITIDETYNVGGLTYTEFSYTEENGEYFINDSDYLAKAYEIDYELFKTTIYDILNSDEIPEEKPTKPLNNNCPFDFAAHEFSRPDPDSKTAIFVNFGKSEEEGGDGRTGFSLRGGNVIPLEKRQKLADFFNSLEWEESVGPKQIPEFLYTYERFCFYSLSDDDFIILNFDGDQSTVTITSCKVRLESDYTDENYDPSDKNAMNRMIQYGAVDETIDINDTTKCYKIDYSLFINKFKEILGDDFREPDMDQMGFFNKEWSVKTNKDEQGRQLTEEDKQAFYDILKSFNWKLEDADCVSISAEEATEFCYEAPRPEHTDSYVILRCDDDISNIIYFETVPDKTTVNCYKLINAGNETYNKQLQRYSCENPAVPYTVVGMLKSYLSGDDTDMVNRIKENLANRNTNVNSEVPVDLSVIDRVDWLCSSIDTKQFDITNDKMQKLKECLGRYDWKMADDSNHFGYDISIIGTTGSNEDSNTELLIGKDWDEKAMICFAGCEVTDIDGKLAVTNIREPKSESDFLNRLYICDDKNAYNEAEKILSE